MMPLFHTLVVQHWIVRLSSSTRGRVVSRTEYLQRERDFSDSLRF